MKSSITLKEFNALFDAVQTRHANAPAIQGWSPRPTLASLPDFRAQQNGSEDTFREMLHRRAATPSVSAISYRHYRINE